MQCWHWNLWQMCREQYDKTCFPAPNNVVQYGTWWLADGNHRSCARGMVLLSAWLWNVTVHQGRVVNHPCWKNVHIFMACTCACFSPYIPCSWIHLSLFITQVFYPICDLLLNTKMRLNRQWEPGVSPIFLSCLGSLINPTFPGTNGEWLTKPTQCDGYYSDSILYLNDLRGQLACCMTRTPKKHTVGQTSWSLSSQYFNLPFSYCLHAHHRVNKHLRALCLQAHHQVVKRLCASHLWAHPDVVKWVNHYLHHCLTPCLLCWARLRPTVV